MQSVSRNFLTILLPLLVLVASQPARASEEQTWLAVLTGKVTAVSETSLSIAVERRGVAFTDRPKRQVMLIGAQEFVDTMWAADGSFSKDPPNASISDDTHDRISVVTLSKGAVEGDALNLIIVLLEGNLPEAGDYVAITIDAINDVSRAHYSGG